MFGVSNMFQEMLNDMLEYDLNEVNNEAIYDEKKEGPFSQAKIEESKENLRDNSSMLSLSANNNETE